MFFLFPAPGPSSNDNPRTSLKTNHRMKERPTTILISTTLSFSHFTANLSVDPLPPTALPTEILPLLSRELKTRVQRLMHTDGEKKGLGSAGVGRSGRRMVHEKGGDGGQQSAELRQSLDIVRHGLKQGCLMLNGGEFKMKWDTLLL